MYPLADIIRPPKGLPLETDLYLNPWLTLAVIMLCCGVAVAALIRYRSTR